MKHAILLRLLGALTSKPDPLTVIDTHAGAGIHDLRGGEASRTGEADGGVRVLMRTEAPPVFDALKAAVRRANRGDEVRFYPGSPLLIADSLRARDKLIACELRDDDHAALKAALPRQAGAEALREDGWRVARARARGAGRLLILVDPPFEKPDDGVEAARLVADIRRASPNAVMALWSPIKDLDGFDQFVGRIEDACSGARVILAQSRLRPLSDPMRMNGSAVTIVDPPSGIEVACDEIARWVASAMGEAGALGRAEIL